MTLVITENHTDFNPKIFITESLELKKFLRIMDKLGYFQLKIG